MIQLIYDYEDATIAEDICTDFNIPFIVIPEMHDAYLTLIEPERVGEFETALKLPPLRFDVIGSYNRDGSQYIWTEPTEKKWNHSINKYKNSLNDIPDGNGGFRPPTTAEALNIQVNKISGDGDRNTIDPI